MTMSHAEGRSSAATTRFREGVERGDARMMLDALTPDAFLRSPVAAGLRFEGREQLAALFDATTAVYEDIEVTRDFGDESSWLLGFRARIEAQEFEEMLLLGLAEDGGIEELTASIRPMPGLAAVAAAVGTRLARRHGRGRAAAMAGLTAPLVAMTRAGDSVGPRLLRPIAGSE
jgi:hypothetical protein